MAATCHSFRSTVVKLSLSRATRSKPPLSVRVWGCSAMTQGFPTAKEEGPSYIFVGAIETASQETLEALYRQAQDAYYSGEPLIVDDMFDRVELKLRRYGSKSAVKYPRCSMQMQRLWRNDLVALKGACPNCGRRYLHLSNLINSMILPIEQSVMSVNALWNSVPRLSNLSRELGEDGYMAVYILSCEELEVGGRCKPSAKPI